MMTTPPDLARRIWAILAEECGAEGDSDTNASAITQCVDRPGMDYYYFRGPLGVTAGQVVLNAVARSCLRDKVA